MGGKIGHNVHDPYSLLAAAAVDIQLHVQYKHCKTRITTVLSVDISSILFHTCSMASPQDFFQYSDFTLNTTYRRILQLHNTLPYLQKSKQYFKSSCYSYSAGYSKSKGSRVYTLESASNIRCNVMHLVLLRTVKSDYTLPSMHGKGNSPC